jgi:hypothetical protein
VPGVHTAQALFRDDEVRILCPHAPHSHWSYAHRNHQLLMDSDDEVLIPGSTQHPPFLEHLVVMMPPALPNR